MSLLLLRRRRAKRNVGQAEFVFTAQGHGRLDLSALAATLEPKKRVIRGHRGAAFPAIDAYGHGRLSDDIFVRLLMSAA